MFTDCRLSESRRLEVRCGIKSKDQTRKVYVHMLNGTLCATERALCCLVENYQTPDVRPPALSAAAVLTQGS
jgi:seryl-tRNA synthetase